MLIYFVDDDQDILDLYKDSFEVYFSENEKDLNIELKFFLSPKVALAEIEKNAPKVLVTDYQMDELSGTQLAHKTKGIRQDTKVILVSDSSYMIEPHFEDSPFDLLVSKVFDPNELGKRILNFLK